MLAWGAMAGFGSLVRTPFTAVVCLTSMFNFPAASDIVIGGIIATAFSFTITSHLEPVNLGLTMFGIYQGNKSEEQLAKEDAIHAWMEKEDYDANLPFEPPKEH